MMKRAFFTLVSGCAVVALLLSPLAATGGSIAQGGAEKAAEAAQPLGQAATSSALGWAGERMTQPASPVAASALADAKGVGMASTGGPDDFGYTWDDGVAFGWIDALSGTNTGMTDTCHTAAIALGFPFKFYENTYSTVYVSFSGYVSFEPITECYPTGVTPHPLPPNNVIAPSWKSLYGGQVWYAQGGTAPNRYLVIEWYLMMTPTDIYDPSFPGSFELTLNENGNMKVQAPHEANSTYCPMPAIEDSTGWDGLVYPSCVDGSAVGDPAPSPCRTGAVPSFRAR